MGAAWEATLEVGGGAGSLRNVLPHGRAGGTLVWRGDMDNHRYNESGVRGSKFKILDAGHI